MSEKKDNLRMPSLSGLYGLSLTPSLPTLLESYVVNNFVYKDVRVDLDGYTFNNCAFINCVLQSSKGNFKILDCHLRNCAIAFAGNAIRAVRLSSVLLGSWEQLAEPFRAHIEEDGGITIT